MPDDGSVRIDRVTTQYGVLVLAGPRSREVLAKVCDEDLANAAFPWLTARHINIGAAGVIAMRVNFIGELGYEIHHPIEMQNYIFDRLMAAGAEFGIKPFGIRAMDSLRLEKSYKLVGRELSIEYAALKSELGRFIDMTEGISRQGSAAQVARQGLRQQARDAGAGGVKDFDARGSEPVITTASRGRAHDLGRLRLADREIAGAGDGQAGAGEGRNGADGARARPGFCGAHRRRQPLRSGERGAARLGRLYDDPHRASERRESAFQRVHAGVMP